MAKFASAATTPFVLFSLMTAAHAAVATGDIKKVDGARRLLILTDGSTFKARRHVELFAFTVGEKVIVNYHKNGAEMDITSIRPAP